ncbi:MAG: hypothetical protein E6H04_03115 [Bacillati bacterium ANGP1]|uniref:Creatininase family protein n=1 Tax=Candidatus Segetimicrobium genomatis TaxID=2569760 RepID=A0A537JIP1_9BACT|nr:MAG: hypothetical protein E6H04_03115 [Terrabacteria group bacterium ANGP1]
MKKHRLHEMSWMEAQEAFKKSDTVIMPVGTLHAHGPTPIGTMPYFFAAFRSRLRARSRAASFSKAT